MLLLLIEEIGFGLELLGDNISFYFSNIILSFYSCSIS